MRMLTRVNSLTPGCHCCEDWTINVTIIVKNAPSIFETFRDIITIDDTSRVLTRENTSPSGGNIFQQTKTIFKLVQHIIRTNILPKFYKDGTINVALRVKNAPPPDQNHLELIQDVLTKFHVDPTINLASRVLTRKNALPNGGHVFQPTVPFSNSKNALPPGGHVFQQTVTIFELLQDIMKTNLLTKFCDDRTINMACCVSSSKNAPPHRQYIIGTNLLSKTFHEDRIINVASRLKNALPPCSHVCQAAVAIFELVQDIIEMYLLTKFHDWT
ncbi:hypothetical protein DPMN_165120 [Dreissena polymorpha]|uniref:Uncharacterized protein n=1 Tax=Dreissena polymorpha TaxID=45954 RepID=A0A9D4EZ18_DREPO|nr:hypothetical protein DPMN_165120 [Dreissena polymorpha]